MTKRRKFTRLAALFLLIAIVIISCAPQPQEEPEQEPVDAAEPAEVAEPEETAEPDDVDEPEEGDEVVVTMTSRTFEPAQVTISAGTTIRWENTSNIPHTVTSGTRGSPTGLFDVNLAPGEVFSFTFEEPGVFDYYCIPHPGMDGVITVE